MRRSALDSATNGAGARPSRRRSAAETLQDWAQDAANMRRSWARSPDDPDFHYYEPDRPKATTFVDAAAMKERVRQNLSKPKYSVMDFYHDTGIFQAVAKSAIFDKLTLLVIAFNAIWIAIDTDCNSETLLMKANPMFIVAENFFCVFFTFEWLTRFMAFRRKRDGLRDGWFVFDSFMVVMMVLETWVFTLVLVFFMSERSEGTGGNTGIMRLARLLRLSRMARMGKLLRVMPELLIMLKGMKAATRSVFFTLLLLSIIVYVFAIAFTQLGDDTYIGEEKFFSVPQSMYTLLIYGIFLDNIGHVALPLKEEPVLFVLFFVFVLIGALTVMNMLVGVLCEVVSAVAATEQEEMLVSYVHERLSRVMALVDEDGGGTISKHEFNQILGNVEAVRCLSDVGVDVFSLIDLTDYIFEDETGENPGEEIELDFARFMDVILQLRGSNQATVKDIVDLRKFLRAAMQENQRLTSLVLDKLEKGAKLSNDTRCGAPGTEPVVSFMNAGEASPRKHHSWAPTKAVGILRRRSSCESNGSPPTIPMNSMLTWIPVVNEKTETLEKARNGRKSSSQRMGDAASRISGGEDVLSKGSSPPVPLKQVLDWRLHNKELPDNLETANVPVYGSEKYGEIYGSQTYGSEYVEDLVPKTAQDDEMAAPGPPETGPTMDSVLVTNEVRESTDEMPVPCHEHSPCHEQFVCRDDLALKGKWAPFEANGCVDPAHLDPPIKDDDRASGLLMPKPIKRPSCCDPELLDEDGDSVPDCQPRGSKREPPLIQGTPMARIRVSNIEEVDDPDIEDFQRQIDQICGQLAAVINDAITSADRCAEKRYQSCGQVAQEHDPVWRAEPGFVTL